LEQALCQTGIKLGFLGYTFDYDLPYFPIEVIIPTDFTLPTATISFVTAARAAYIAKDAAAYSFCWQRGAIHYGIYILCRYLPIQAMFIERFV